MSYRERDNERGGKIDIEIDGDKKRKRLRDRKKEVSDRDKKENINFCLINIYIFYFFHICHICHCLLNCVNLFFAIRPSV